MNTTSYQCPKCSNPTYETGQVRAAGGFWSKIFDVQGARFTRITCTRCRYTELYMADTSKLENVFDFLTNG